MKFFAPTPPSLADLTDLKTRKVITEERISLMSEDTLIVIPARVGSTRLPGKMLADINGDPLIVRTYKSVVAANVGPVIVACDGQEIVDVIKAAGGEAIITDPALPSGTDRVYAAYKKYDTEKKFKYIINVQGDLPFVDSRFISSCAELMRTERYDMTTPAAPITDESYKVNSVVKIAVAHVSETEGKALYFSRSPIPFGGPYYHHVGLYCFRVNALEKFMSLPQSSLEKIEKLEQLRALENGMTIGIRILPDIESPISVDTAEDLERARKFGKSH